MTKAAGEGAAERPSLLLEMARQLTAAEFAEAVQCLFDAFRDDTIYTLFVDAGWAEGARYCYSQTYTEATAHGGFVHHPHNHTSHAGKRYAEVRKITPFEIVEATGRARAALARAGWLIGDAAGAAAAA